MLVTALGVILADLVRQLTLHNTGPGIAIIVIYAGVGVVIARRQPRNPMAWALILFVLMYVLGAAATNYAVLAYRFGYSGLPFAPVAAAASCAALLHGIVLFSLVILLFPDGRLASRRWRWALWAYAGLSWRVAIGSPAQVIAALAGHDVHLDTTGNVVTRGHRAGGSIQGTMAGRPVFALSSGLSFVAHQVLSWRRASGERRQQLKWLACGGAVALVTFIGARGRPSPPRLARCCRSGWWPCR